MADILDDDEAMAAVATLKAKGWTADDVARCLADPPAAWLLDKMALLAKEEDAWWGIWSPRWRRAWSAADDAKEEDGDG